MKYVFASPLMGQKIKIDWEGIQTACMETLTKTTGKSDTAQQVQWNNQL